MMATISIHDVILSCVLTCQLDCLLVDDDDVGLLMMTTFAC